MHWHLSWSGQTFHFADLDALIGDTMRGFPLLVLALSAHRWLRAHRRQHQSHFLRTPANGQLHGDTRGSRYSPLEQITRANFSTLEVAWRFKTDSLGPRPEFKLESTPLMVGGVLYSRAGRGALSLPRCVTGEQRWVHREDEGEGAQRHQGSCRGAARLLDGWREERILYVTPGYRLLALMPKQVRSSPALARTAPSISRPTRSDDSPRSHHGRN